MEPHRDDTDLTAALRSLRPTARPDFIAELDARAAAGFPHREGRDSAIGRASQRLRVERLVEWIRSGSLPPARALGMAGACAVLAIAVATVVVTSTEDDPTSPTGGFAQLDAGAGSVGNDRPRHEVGASGASATQYSAPPPSARSKGSEAAAAGTSLPPRTASQARSGMLVEPASGKRSAVPGGKSGPYAAKARRRDIERSAQIVLATEADEVRATAGKVFAAVHNYDGIVLSSSVRDGGDGEAAATFDLLIPSAKLGDALASFSEIAEVRSRHESTDDITAPTVGLEERVRDGQARVRSLLAQLAAATTDAERVAAEAELRSERRRVAVLRARLSELQRRARFSHVALRIESGAPAAAQAGGGRWGIDDALDDAGDILSTAAAVTVIGLAIFAPLALVCLLAWLARRAWVRRSRERTLDSRH